MKVIPRAVEAQRRGCFQRCKLVSSQLASLVTIMAISRTVAGYVVRKQRAFTYLCYSNPTTSYSSADYTAHKRTSPPPPPRYPAPVAESRHTRRYRSLKRFGGNRRLVLFRYSRLGASNDRPYISDYLGGIDERRLTGIIARPYILSKVDCAIRYRAMRLRTCHAISISDGGPCPSKQYWVGVMKHALSALHIMC